jgi:hypothetical protein
VAIVVQITLSAPEPVTVQVADGGAAVTVAAVLSPQAVTVAAVLSPQAVNVAATQAPQTVQVEAVSRIVPGDPGAPGADGPPGANAEIVVLTLAAYLALAPGVQMDGRWYVIPKT